MGKDQTFRWGILGTGPVARKFALGLRRLPDALVTRVASGRRENAERFARDLGVVAVSGTAGELAQSADVDAIYIATPPALHRAHAVACMEAGKAVLVEKPFAATRGDAEAMAETARSRGVFCMEGLWTRFLPLVDEVRARIAAGDIGELRSFSGSFAIPTAPDPDQGLFRPETGGGALLHRGIYPLSLACHLMGPPVAEASLATLDASGIDATSAVILRHVGGGLSTVTAGLDSAAPNDCVIGGTAGMIHIHAPIYRPFRMTLTRVPVQGAARPGNPRTEALKESGLMQGAHQRLSRLTGLVRGRRSRDILRPYAGNGYHYEAAELMACVRAGAPESRLMPLAESVALAGILETARIGWTGTA